MEKIEEIFIKAMRKHEERKKQTLSLYYAGVRKNILIEDILYFSVSNRIVNVIYYENQVTERMIKNGRKRSE